MKSIIRECDEQCTPTNLGNLDETENSIPVIQQAAGLCALPPSGHKRAREPRPFRPSWSACVFRPRMGRLVHQEEKA